MVKISKSDVGEAFQSALHFIVWNWPSLLLFEIMYKMVLYAFVSPLEEALLVRAMDWVGIDSLTLPVLPQLLLNPPTFCLMCLCLFLAVFPMYVEICAIFSCFSAVGKGRRLTPFQLLIQGGKRAGYLLHLKGLGALPLLLALLPLTGFCTSLPALKGFWYPRILEEARTIGGGFFLAVCAFSALMFFYVLRHFFSLAGMAIGSGDFRESLRRSMLALEGRGSHIITTIIFWNGFCAIFLWGLCLLVEGLFFLWSTAAASMGEGTMKALWGTDFSIWNSAAPVASTSLLIFNLAMVTALYYQCRVGRPACVGWSRGVMKKEGARV